MKINNIDDLTKNFEENYKKNNKIIKNLELNLNSQENPIKAEKKHLKEMIILIAKNPSII